MKNNVITLSILQITQSQRDLSEIKMMMLMIVQKIQSKRDLMKINVKTLMIVMKIKRWRWAWWTLKKVFQRLAEWSQIFIALQNFSLTCTFFINVAHVCDNLLTQTSFKDRKIYNFNLICKFWLKSFNHLLSFES